MPTTTIQETTINGVTVRLAKITGLQRIYWTIDALNKEMFSCRQLKTVTIRDEDKAYNVIASLVAQLNNNVDFWDLEFTA